MRPSSYTSDSAATHTRRERAGAREEFPVHGKLTQKRERQRERHEREKRAMRAYHWPASLAGRSEKHD